jgi:hypothetical protein
MMSRVLSVLIVVSFVVTASASTQRMAVPASPEPCSLLTPAEVSDAFGVAVKAGEPANPTLCSWSAGGKRLTLLITDDKHFAGARKNGDLPGITIETVSGVGDDAVLTTTSGNFPSIMVKKGAVYFMLRVYGFPIDQAKAKEKALATAAAKKI